MVVCGACRSTLTRDAEASRRVGRMAEVVEDYSVIQVGTRGISGHRGFRVLGRLQMKYDAGSWNEWYIGFNDGTDGWLSDSAGQYAVTRRNVAPAAGALLLAFDDVRVGEPIKVDDVLHVVSDRRKARCIGGEGELPLVVGDGWEARVVDARRGSSFVTVDYSDATPVVYSGTASARLTLQADTLRRQDAVEESAGRYRGRVLPLDCPNCAGTVSIAVAMATQVVCPSCGSLLDCTGARAEIVEAQRRVARFNTTLALGAQGRFEVVYTIIGIMRCDVPDDSSEPSWVEYLLFNPEKGYQWLVETRDGWQKVKVCDEWPILTSEGSCIYGGRNWLRTYEYRSRVTQVFGAFHWRVQRGDTGRVTDFVKGNQTLTREQSDDEVVWSQASKVSETMVLNAFGVPTSTQPKARRRRAAAVDSGDDELVNIAVMATVILVLLASTITFTALLFGVGLIWAPLAFMEWSARSDGSAGENG
jgi:ribosomal protein S27E